jgi:heme O synthase-like polyprenyltransferase
LLLRMQVIYGFLVQDWLVASAWPYFLNMGHELYLWGIGTAGAVYFILFFKSLKSKSEFNRVLFLYSIFYLCFIFALLLI